MKIIAKILTFLFHPLLIPSYFFALILFYFPFILAPNLEVKIFVLSFVFVATFIIPAITLIFMHRTGLISSLSLRNKEERFYPFISTALIYGSASYYFFSEPFFDPVFRSSLIVVTICILVVAIANRFIKLSAHAVAAAGLCGVLLRVSLDYSSQNLLLIFLVSILITGLVSSARLLLNAHSLKEIGIGLGVGFLVSFFTYPYILNT